MFLRVVRGDSARFWCVLDVVIMIGFDLGISNCTGGASCKFEPVSGEVATEGPLGVVVLDLLIAGVERDAALASAFARSGSCISVVSSDRRDVRFGLESTRWKRSFSFTDDGPLASSESSQSEESSSSSMALSDTSSSSSSLSKTGLFLAAAALPIATSSLKEVCFLLPSLRRLLLLRRLSESTLRCMCESREDSSSPEDVPMVNMAPFFFGGAGRYCGDVLRMGVGCEARLVCERYDDGAPPGTKPRMMLWELISVAELSEPCEPTGCEVLEPSEPLVSTVDADDSRSVACESVLRGVRSCDGGDGEEERSSVDRFCVFVEGGSLARGDGVDIGSSIGSRFVSLIEMTIF